MDPKKIANNMLELLFDPTVIPVEQRLYFRPEERLQNEDFAKAKADAYKSFGDQRHNSDFYPKNNIQREASIMDRKTIIASLDVLSHNFDESDPIGTDLRTMAYAVANMSEEELVERLAKKKVEFITCPKCGNEKVMKQTGYCMSCKTKGIGKAAAESCKACGEETCACEKKEAGLSSKEKAELEQVLSLLKNMKPGQKLASEVLAKMNLSGKVLLMATLLAQILGVLPAHADTPAIDPATKSKIEMAVQKEDMASIDSLMADLMKSEEVSLAVKKDEGRMQQKLDQVQNVETAPSDTPSSGGRTLDLRKADFWSKEAAEAVQQAILSDVLPDAVVAKKKKVPAVPAVEEVPAAEPAVMAKEEEVPEVTTTPAPEVKEAAKEEEVTTTPAPKVVEPKEAQVVDTHILAYEGIELGEGNNMDDVVLTADDKAQLDQLFK